MYIKKKKKMFSRYSSKKERRREESKKKLLQKRKKEREIQKAVEEATRKRKAEAQKLAAQIEESRKQAQAAKAPAAAPPEPVSRRPWAHASFVPDTTILEIQWNMVDDEGEQMVESYVATYKGPCEPEELYTFRDDDGTEEPIDVPVVRILYEYDDDTSEESKVCFLSDSMVFDLEHECVLFYKNEEESGLISVAPDATEESVRELVRPIIESTFMQFIDHTSKEIDKHDMEVQLLIVDKFSEMREHVTEGLVKFLLDNKANQVTETDMLNNMMSEITKLMKEKI